MRSHMRVKPICSNCKTQKTPLWRRGHNNTYNCNACGLYYRIYKKDRPLQYNSNTYRQRNRSKKEECFNKTENNDSFYDVTKPDSNFGKNTLKGNFSKVKENPLKSFDKSVEVFIEEERKRKDLSFHGKEAKFRDVSLDNICILSKDSEYAAPYLKEETHCYKYGTSLKDNRQKRPNFSFYPKEAYFKMPRPHFNNHLERSSDSALFSELKKSQKDSYIEKKACILSKEEMEAAEALANFAYYAKRK